MKFEYPEGATPIDLDEAARLIPKNILLQHELNECEQANIIQGEIWLFRQKTTIEEFATIDFIKRFHYKMFNKTWRWAGHFRKSDNNIGIELPTKIGFHQVFSCLILSLVISYSNGFELFKMPNKNNTPK